MKHGLIRIAAITPKARVADLTFNCDAAVAAAVAKALADREKTDPEAKPARRARKEE